VERDFAAAHAWYLCAARQGHARAQFNLGLMYAAGQGLARDLVQAWCWLQRAERSGAAGAARHADKVGARMDPALLEQAQRYLAEFEATNP